MKIPRLIIRSMALVVGILSTFNLQLSTASAQGTAFSYQGKLSVSGNPANGIYDLRFTVCDALTNGSILAGPMTNSATTVSNGLFAATLDFGGGIFTGPSRWLQLDVRTNGSGAFTALSPRALLLPVPYALMANSASNLIGALPVSQLNGTLSAEQLPATVVTNNANNLTMSGNFSGNGAGLTNIPGSIAWQVVSGTNVQAVPNNGYLVMNDATVVVTLPASPNIGDVVRVSGSGAGGWKIAQGAVQSVLTVNLPGNTIGAVWTARDTSRYWNCVASSSDGSKLIAAVGGNNILGQIYTSTDSGVTWTPRESNRRWQGVASSADGSKLVAVVGGVDSFATYGQIYTSTDSGVTWTPRDSNRLWQAVASSADGSKLVAATAYGQIYTSTDSGVTWTARDSARRWQAVASSADGSKLVAGAGDAYASPDQIYTSTDSGVTWTPRESSRYWFGVTSSSDGSKLVAVDSSNLGGGGGRIYTSTDSGVTWTPRDSNRYWRAVASSGDGSKLVAGVEQGQIYTSTDSGLNWTPRASNTHWYGFASSADGSKLAAVSGHDVYIGQIYTSVPSSTVGLAGYLQGGQNSAIELQYIGNGQFIPLSYAGTIGAY